MKINEKNLCMFATTPPADLEGWLNKRGETNKSWQRRWFVLKGNLLFYFEKKSDKEPLGMIILEGCTVELAEESENYCFKIIFHGPNNRSYYLSTESQNNMEEWMKALTCAGYDYMKLMIAELQRQLDEMEGQCKEPPPESTTQPSPPKAPPRRQNPFNKPLVTEFVSNADLGTGSGSSRKGLTVSSQPDDPSPQATTRRKAMGPTKSSDAIATVAADQAQTSSSLGTDQRDGARAAVVTSFSFETMHSALGGPVLADVNKWNASRRDVHAPSDVGSGRNAADHP